MEAQNVETSNAVLNMPILVLVFILLTVGSCIYFTHRSSENKKQGILDDGAQQAVTVGVAFTFLGVIISLWDFNVSNVDNIKQTITNFLSGMKLAFITSIIGIGFSMYIRSFQSDIERKAQENQKSHSDDISQKSEQMLKSLANLQELLKTNANVQNDIAANTNTMAQNSTAATAVTEAIQNLKESIDHSSSGALERAVANLSDKMDQYIRTSQNTNGAIQNVAEQLSAQTKAIDSLGMSLQKSNEEQIGAIDSLGNVLKDSGNTQIDAINELGEKLQSTLKTSEETQNANIVSLGKILQDSGAEQIAAIQNLGSTLSRLLKESGDEQNTRLDSMNGLIATMLDYSKQTYNNSVTALNEARDYQKDSLEISRNQQQILSDNTDRIAEMKDAFNKFLDDMAKKNNEEFIKALNESMKDLNQRLTEQFGDNFKQLNEAVIKLKDWQEDYQKIVEDTTEELRELNDTFKKFATDIAPKVADNAERLQKSVDIFAETSEKNIAVQVELNEATQRLIDSIGRSEEVAENLKNIHEGLTEYQEKFIKSLETSFKNHQKKTLEAMQTSADSLNAMIVQTQQTVTTQTQNTADKLSEIATKQEEYTKSIAEHQEKILDNLETEFKEHQDKTIIAIEETAQKITETVEKTTRKITSQMQATEETFESIIANQFAYSDSLKKHQEKFLNEIEILFTNYQDSILKSMQKSVDNFDEVVAQVQQNATDAIQNTLNMFDEIIRRQQNKTESQMQTLSDRLAEIAKQDQETVRTALGNVKESIDTMDAKTLEFALNATDRIKQFDNTSQEILNKISLALDGFSADFQTELEKSMTNLTTNLGKMLEKNSEVARKNSEELAAILGTVTKKLVEEYQKLADHIADIDKEILERRAS